MAWQSLIWVIFAAVSWIVTYLLVKKHRIKELWKVAFWGGIVLTIILQIMVIHVFKLWNFQYEYFTVINIPFSLVVAWSAEAILFINYIPSRPIWQTLYIGALAFATMIVNAFFIINGMQIIINWNLFYTFLLAVASHIIIAYVIVPLTRDEFLRNY